MYILCPVQVLIHPTESCNEDDEMDRNNSLEKLTETDRVLLRRTWRCLSRELEKLAVDIFEMIFEQTPEAKLMFPFMKLNYKEDEKKHREFTFHALRFIQVQYLELNPIGYFSRGSIAQYSRS